MIGDKLVELPARQTVLLVLSAGMSVDLRHCNRCGSDFIVVPEVGFLEDLHQAFGDVVNRLGGDERGDVEAVPLRVCSEAPEVVVEVLFHYAVFEAEVLAEDRQDFHQLGAQVGDGVH